MSHEFDSQQWTNPEDDLKGNAGKLVPESDIANSLDAFRTLGAVQRAGSQDCIAATTAAEANLPELTVSDASSNSNHLASSKSNHVAWTNDTIKNIGVQASMDCPQSTKITGEDLTGLFGVNHFEVNHMVEEYGKNLDAKGKQELKEALDAVLAGDANGLKKMVPYSPESSSVEVQEAFKKVLESNGYKVNVNGWAEKRPDGARHGELSIIEPENDFFGKRAMKLTYDKEAGPGARSVSSVTTSFVEPQAPTWSTAPRPCG